MAGFTFDETGFTFDVGRANRRAQVILGRVYGGRASAVRVFAALEHIAAHPSTARHLAHKMAAHFVADDPSSALVDHIATAYRQSGGNLAAMATALVEHPAAWQDFPAKVRTPIELVVAGLRAFDVPEQAMPSDRFPVGNPLWVNGPSRMGQPLFRPPGPDGWPDRAEAWITPQGLSARIAWARDCVRQFDRTVDPRRFAAEALADMVHEETRFAVSAADTAQDGLLLALVSPEFNRR